MQTDTRIVREKSAAPPPLRPKLIPPPLFSVALFLAFHCEVKINRMREEMHFMGRGGSWVIWVVRC